MRGVRSKLFVPASRPDLCAKALAGDADALSFDLEDAVAEARKDEARGLLRSFLLSPESRGHGKTLIVRVNAMDTPHFGADIAEMVRDGVQDRKSTRLNSSHLVISYAVFCLKKKKTFIIQRILIIKQYTI